MPLLAFTPYAAACAPIGFVLAFVLRRWWASAVAGLAAVALAAAVLPRTVDFAPDASGQPRRVLSANVLAGAVPARELVGLVRRTRADVLSVQELTPEYAGELDAAGLRELLPSAVLEPRARVAGTGLYAGFRLRPRPPVEAGFTMARATDGKMEYLAVHPPAPRSSGALPLWRRGLRALPTGRGTTRILAGDFNATLDHAELRRLLDTGYDDAAATTGEGLAGTWPARGARLPRVAIDHVLASGGCEANDTEVFPLPGSDHRAVLATLACGG